MVHFSLSEISRFVELDKARGFWLGMDVHKKTYHIALLRYDNSVFTWTSPAIPEKILQQILQIGIHIYGLCYEAGPTGFQLARVFIESGIPAIVAAPNKVPRSVSPGAKTDRLDCIKLAQFVSKGLIKSITVPTVQEEAERALLRRRFQLVDNLRRSKQRIKAQFLYAGKTEPDELKKWKFNCIETILNMDFPEPEKDVLKSHLRELINLKEERQRVEHQLREIADKPEHREVLRYIMTVPGVGFITAITFHLELFRPERFKRSEDLACYLGLAPMVHHSGERTPNGHIVPVGQQRLRSVLVEASWMWISKDSFAAKLYKKYISRTGIKQKAVTAVAHKLAVILWRISIEKRAYRNQIA